ncbi:alpha-ribazole phosphatase family protein [Hymenobacter cellulosilyticus]|uniref:Alpha-ribazole phosphatase family protein n=1 Tax=Hymenobacter cellulosilyticus TaxID=2932248 RepID=A0A8T9PZP7_9BACT|nr:alpha-ribazole phosphatase family protein [Hymenobacter cellulosilyticus]UOQ70684.1 alpha-ribazole phosphatase family protein [Hymenobacter cellulosilyticus]
MDIYLIRHTSVATAAGICYGQTDVALSSRYEQEKERLCRVLAAGLGAGAVRAYASPLSRCRILAEDVVEGPICLDERLKEYHFGRWEMQAWAELPGHELEPWKADFVTQRAPEGETFTEVQQRAVAFLTEVLTQPAAEPEADVLIFAHAALIRTLLCHCLGLPLANAFRLNIDYGSVTKVRYQNQQFLLDYVNR